MTYWESILNEVLNKQNKKTRFSYTNLGDSKSKSKKSYLSSAQTSGNGKEHKAYYLGDEYTGIYFTKREAECVWHLLKGNTIVNVAEILGFSSRTVEFYVKNMKMKLRCGSKAELLDKVVETDLIKNADFSEESEGKE